MKIDAEKLIEIVKFHSPDDSDFPAMRLALEDGEFLGRLVRQYGALSQEVVEAAYERLSQLCGLPYTL